MNKMRVLELDIETAPGKAYIWKTWKDIIPIIRLISPGYVLCWAARWQGERKIMFSSIKNDGKRGMIKKIHKLLDEADAVVHYNGKNFDRKHLNTEFLLQGMPPTLPARDIDLLHTARRQFKFTSNKLEYIVEFLGIGHKLKHQGFDLWKGCMAGDAAVWRVMERYNKHDVRLLGPLYKLFQPWIVNHPNRALWIEDDSKPICRACGSKHVVMKGEERTNVLIYQRYKCMDCGKPLRGRKRIRTSGDGVLI